MEDTAFVCLHRQGDSGTLRQIGATGARRIDEGRATYGGPVGQLNRLNLTTRANDAGHLGLAVLHAQGNGFAPKRLHQAVGIEPTLPGLAKRARIQIIGVHPGVTRLQLGRGQQNHIRVQTALDLVVGFKDVFPRLCGEEQVTFFMKPDVGAFAIDRQVVANLLDELRPELGHLNVAHG